MLLVFWPCWSVFLERHQESWGDFFTGSCQFTALMEFLIRVRCTSESSRGELGRSSVPVPALLFIHQVQLGPVTWLAHFSTVWSIFNHRGPNAGVTITNSPVNLCERRWKPWKKFFFKKFCQTSLICTLQHPWLVAVFQKWSWIMHGARQGFCESVWEK